MEHILGQEWEIVPAGGATGEAFLAQHDKQRLFLKRNSSPFLAVLSAEGIVPKLVWTKRMENGDVISAQQWLEGRELKPHEMKQQIIAKLLGKIHRSGPLLRMLKRLGKSPLSPNQLLQSIEEELAPELKERPLINKSLSFLQAELQNVQYKEKVVCHCDVNHNNWLLTENNQLYLIDWDGAMIGDPAIDLGMLLYCYIPREEWDAWIKIYGLELSEHLLLRMKWYVLEQTLTSVQWYHTKLRFQEMENRVHYLEEIFKF
ncbi:phosphotransferase [Cytobacillus sp. Hz8]|uniref:phosphotransferase n=1 Tax=Cytobacillus sp. Hz8 TaxID=3347168 RepID=UPI0035E2FCCA